MGNMAKICIAIKYHRRCFLIILFVTGFFQPSHNTKREAKNFSSLKRLENTAGRREGGKMLLTQFLFLCKLGIFCPTKPGIMKSSFLF